VQWRKIMFGNRSAEGELAVACLHTVTCTCQLQELNVLAYPAAAIRCHRRRQAVASLLPKRLTSELLLSFTVARSEARRMNRPLLSELLTGLPSERRTHVRWQNRVAGLDVETVKRVWPLRIGQPSISPSSVAERLTLSALGTRVRYHGQPNRENVMPNASPE
jgi:hypothetical protein